MYMWSLTKHRYEWSVHVHVFKHIVTWEYTHVDAKKTGLKSEAIIS